MKDTSEYMKDTVEEIKKMMGEPRNYGLTKEEEEAIRRTEEEAKLKKEAEERAEKERQEAEEAAERKRRQDEWVSGCNNDRCGVKGTIGAQTNVNKNVNICCAAGGISECIC